MRHWRNNRETKRRLKTGADFQTAFYMAGNRQMKYWKVLLPAAVAPVLVGAVIVQADKQQMLRRAVFLDDQIQAYYAVHRVYPQPYEWLAEAERNGKRNCIGVFSAEKSKVGAIVMPMTAAGTACGSLRYGV